MLLQVELDKIIEALTYFFEFVIANLLLPGQVENWIFILDLNKTGIMSLPKMVRCIATLCTHVLYPDAQEGSWISTEQLPRTSLDDEYNQLS